MFRFILDFLPLIHKLAFCLIFLINYVNKLNKLVNLNNVSFEFDALCISVFYLMLANLANSTVDW